MNVPTVARITIGLDGATGINRDWTLAVAPGTNPDDPAAILYAVDPSGLLRICGTLDQLDTWTTALMARLTMHHLLTTGRAPGNTHQEVGTNEQDN